MPLDWNDVTKRYTENKFITIKNGEKREIKKITNKTIIIFLPSGDQSISRKNLERAVEIIEAGHYIGGPSDYRKMVADDRPTYAYGVLKDLGYV